MSKIALIDMDGTLFDHDQALRYSLIKVIPDNWCDYVSRCNSIHDFEKHGSWAKRLMDLVRMQPGWWSNLPKYQPGWDIYEVVKEVGFSIKILTKGPNKKPAAWTEKVQCIHKHFGEDMPIDIVGKWTVVSIKIPFFLIW